MVKLNIIGAFDRFNFGDVLFAYILKSKLAQFKNTYDFQYVSTAEVDLRRKGGLVTVPMKTMFNNSDKASVFIIAGGEVLAAPWWYMYLCLVDNSKIQDEHDKVSIDGYDASNLKAQFFFKCHHKFPWVLERVFMRNYKALLIYNAVGGSSLQKLIPEDRKYITDQLETANYLSVRDTESRDVIINAGFPKDQIKVYPDCGILISEVFPKEYVNKKATIGAKRLVEKSKEYVVFQAGRYHVMNQQSTDVIVEQLLKIAEHIDVILLPFSDASSHEDNIILEEIFWKANKANVRLVKDINMYDIMYYVIHAKLFMGTSLHGNIISFSYGTPSAGLTYIDAKLPRFIETWMKPAEGFQVCYEFNQLYEAYIKSKALNKKEYDHYASVAIAMGNENIQNISALVAENAKQIRPVDLACVYLKNIFCN